MARQRTYHSQKMLHARNVHFGAHALTCKLERRATVCLERRTMCSSHTEKGNATGRIHELSLDSGLCPPLFYSAAGHGESARAFRYCQNTHQHSLQFMLELLILRSGLVYPIGTGDLCLPQTG